MSAISVFDMLKIGVGPSSSHTLGPWRAAEAFVKGLDELELINKIKAVEVHLYGSLSLTGKGHATDLACALGLMALDPVSINTSEIPDIIGQIKSNQVLLLGGKQKISFNWDEQINFHREFKSEHANTLSFKAYFEDQSIEKYYYSLGGGFIATENEINNLEKSETKIQNELKYPIYSGKDAIRHCEREGLDLAELVFKNETYWRAPEEINTDLDKVWSVMLDAMYTGCHTEGILPGGLNVTRRAFETHEKLMKGKEAYTLETWINTIRDTEVKFREILKWVGCWALAVNEVNASLGRVVTAPTNGSAGVIPAVLMYYLCIEDHDSGVDEIRKFLMVAGEIGCIFKKNATISAAMGGCQAEIGVSSAMAAAGLCHLLGGDVKQITMAAEIAMEHHLGLTCDPIGGLVQIPCIERNAMGAIKAIKAAELALDSDPDKAKVSLDQVIDTMWKTAQDMNSKYKETAQGGLAISVNQVDC